MMSKDKYLWIFLKPNGGYCVYYPSNIFTQTLNFGRAFLKAFRRQNNSVGAQNIVSLFIRFSSIHFNNLLGMKTCERILQSSKTGEYHLGNIKHLMTGPEGNS